MSEPTNLDQASSPKKTAQHSEVVVGIENKRSASALSMNDAQSIIDQHCSKRTVNIIRQDIINLPPNAENPQDFLDRIFRQRGYSVERFCSLHGGYHCRPSPLQVASHGTELVKAVRRSEADKLDKLLRCGLSPNPCNSFGESIVHMVCRRGDHKLLQVLLNHGSSLQVTDDFGRTPLHDACWTAEPFFELVEMVLQHDRRLINITDCRGSLPLAYVSKKHWESWIEFLDNKKDVFWPVRDASKEGEEASPELTNEPPHTKAVPLPINPVSLGLARAIATGKIFPDEVLAMSDDERENFKESNFQKSPTISPNRCEQRNVEHFPNQNTNRYSCRGVVNLQPNQIGA